MLDDMGVFFARKRALRCLEMKDAVLPDANAVFCSHSRFHGILSAVIVSTDPAMGLELSTCHLFAHPSSVSLSQKKQLSFANVHTRRVPPPQQLLVDNLATNLILEPTLSTL